jgi:hypothetical protein
MDDKVDGWVAKVARSLAKESLWLRIQTFLKNHKWETQVNERPPKKLKKISDEQFWPA